MLSRRQLNGDYMKDFPIFGIILTVISIMSLITKSSNYLYFNHYLVLKGEYWRLFFYFIATRSISDLYNQVLMCILYSYGFEKKQGSVRFIINVFIYSIIIASTTLLISLKLPITKYLFIGYQDSISDAFSLSITIFCFKYPEESSVKYFCIPKFSLKNKYFPFVLLAVFSLIQHGINCSSIIIIVFALIYVKFEKIFEKFRLNVSYIKFIERKLKNFKFIGTIYYTNEVDNKDDTIETMGKVKAFFGKGVTLKKEIESKNENKDLVIISDKIEKKVDKNINVNNLDNKLMENSPEVDSLDNEKDKSSNLIKK